MLTNAEYRRLTGVSEVTSLRELRDLVERGFLVRHGEKRGAFYALADGAGPRDTSRRDEQHMATEHSSSGASHQFPVHYTSGILIEISVLRWAK